MSIQLAAQLFLVYWLVCGTIVWFVCRENSILDRVGCTITVPLIVLVGLVIVLGFAKVFWFIIKLAFGVPL